MKPGDWLTANIARGAGTLEARKLSGGSIAYYFRSTANAGQRTRIPLGVGLDFNTAKRKATELSLRYQSGERDLRAALDAEQRERERKQNETEEREAADAAKRKATLGALLTAYADQLERDGKPSARSVRGAIERNVRKAWPSLWEMPAAEVSGDALLAIVAMPADAGKLREAAKLRAYLRAAYAAAVKARRNPLALPALRNLQITANPASDLATIEGASNARERALSIAELRAYWHRIRALPDPDGALLRFHLLTGGQRIEQLARATVADYDADMQCVRLRDPKGRRKTPRAHDVPLIPDAIKAMRAMQGGAAGSFLFTTTAGESGAVYATVQTRLRNVCEAMQAAGELERGPFTVGDLRRTVETRLSAAGVGVAARAQLQSHGLGGVQARHYDRHDYMREKREALETLHRILTGHAASVTPIRKRKA
ncbi:MAG: tyrosine-type recombinase/integrase [Xanthomonadaceae bacterium]|nr:tyrosine-type recombinase/integrase [Xanthomonadaceae bacterium]